MGVFFKIVFLVNFLSGHLIFSESKENKEGLKFQLKKDTSRGVVRLGPGWTDRSRVSCAASCMSKYDNCQSFMYHDVTRLCTPGSFMTDNLPGLTVAEGKLYYTRMSCDTSKGFRIGSYDSTTACVGLFGLAMSYQDADVACKKKGGFLASCKTIDKASIIFDLTDTSTVWVGCDNLARTEIFVWKEDGQNVTSDEIDEVFLSGQFPVSSYKCCGYYDTYLETLMCSEKHQYICEINIS